MSQRNKAYSNRMKQLKVKTKRQRAKSHQFKTKKNTPEIFISVESFSCAETRSHCKAYQRLIYILKMYNNFLSSFTDTYYQQLSSAYVLSSPSPITPSSPYTSYSPNSPRSPFAFPEVNTPKSGASSPFAILTKSKNSRKKKLPLKSFTPKPKKTNKVTTDNNPHTFSQFRRNKKKSNKPKRSTSRRKPAKTAAQADAPYKKLESESLGPILSRPLSASSLKGGFYDLYMTKCGEYNNVHLMNDFNHICEKHNLSDLIHDTKLNTTCNIHACICMNRTYRDRLKCCKYSRFREALYLGFAGDENEVITQQLMDKIHNYMLHTFDIGIQLDVGDIKQGDTESEDSKLSDYREDKLCQINEVISEKRELLHALTGRNKYLSKFTSIIDQSNSGGGNNYGANEGHYSPRFYYWSVYADWDGTDKSNPGYTYMDWYVEPKYGSLKHELLSGGANRFLSKTQWHNLISLCALYKYSHFVKIIKADFDDLHGYGIKRYTPISTQHLLSLLIYCNFEAIRNRFVQTFVRVPAQESDESLKERHARFAHLARLLRESVEVFGQRTLFSKVKKFYHCLDKELMLKEISGYFNMPTSTSIHYETVINLNKSNGVILQFADNNDTHLNGGLRYFDVCILSDYCYEYECLFISSLSPIHITTIIQCNYGHNYGYFIHSLNVIYLMMKGRRYKNVLNDGNDEIYKKCAAKLIQHQLFKNSIAHDKKQYEKYHNLPKYIENLLDHFFLNTHQLIINYEHLCYSKQFKLFEQLFIENRIENDKKYIKLDAIFTLFPNIFHITINAIKARLEFDDDHIFRNILKSLSTHLRLNPYLQEIVFKECFPNSVCKSIAKYESKFIQSRWLITQQLATLIFKQSTFDVV